jgi:hypothetical protein
MGKDLTAEAITAALTARDVVLDSDESLVITFSLAARARMLQSCLIPVGADLALVLR